MEIIIIYVFRLGKFVETSKYARIGLTYKKLILLLICWRSAHRGVMFPHIVVQN